MKIVVNSSINIFLSSYCVGFGEHLFSDYYGGP